MISHLERASHQHYLPHDLLWGFSLEHLPADAPVWVAEALRVEPPVVVRRAQAAIGWVAVGVRGKQREQRFAGWMPASAVTRCVAPEQLIEPQLRHAQAHANWPLFKALDQLVEPLNKSGLSWGITGSLGFQLASGIEVIHLASDLDLLLRTEQPLSRPRARALLALLDDAPAAVDMQLQCPSGAVALREWALGASQVLLKTQSRPLLVDNPWALECAVA